LKNKICIYNSKDKPYFKNSKEILKRINTILAKYDRTLVKTFDQQILSSLLLDKILSHKNSQINTYALVNDLLATKLINVNDIKNFLNQTLLHFACENNDQKLCELLLKYDADCLLEDNYRYSPFIITAKRNFLNLNILFVNFVQNRCLTATSQTCWDQIRRAAYYSVCSGHIEIAQHLFNTFKLNSEQICTDSSIELDSVPINGNVRFSELNPLHVAAYKAKIEIVQFLFQNTLDIHKEAFKNKPLNEFRDCTPLEEAFKGLLMLDFSLSSQNSIQLNHFRNSTANSERNKKKYNHLKIINLLIEKGCRFSFNFTLTNGLSKMLAQIFSGAQKDSDFVQFMYSCNFLFKYKLDEIFSLDDYSTKNVYVPDQSSSFDSNTNQNHSQTNTIKNKIFPMLDQLKYQEFSLEQMIDDFLLKVYWACQKVIKDFKGICLSYFVEILLSLHYSGQFFLNMNKLSYLKEKNSDIYAMLEDVFHKPLTLKTFCCISIRKSIKNYGFEKVNSFKIPQCLKNEIFYNQLSKNANYKKYIFYPNLI
jgi:ankyrin repeat protein